jgi:hypothetical protein
VSKRNRVKGAFRGQRRQQAGTQQPADFVVPDDVKADIAMIVRSVEWTVPGLNPGVYTPGIGMSTSGICSFRTATGYKVLHELGIPVLAVIGGMVFKAGPAEEDLLSFCGDDDYGCIVDNNFFGHFWLTRGNEIIDFSVGDWRQNSSG